MTSLMAIKILGVFAFALGSIHVFFPRLLDFENVMKMEGPALKLFRMYFWSYQVKRTDVRGIIWLMNYHVSFVILTIGIANFLIDYWIMSPLSHVILLWMSLWWLLRAFLQFCIGRRKGDWIVFGWFLFLSLIQAIPVVL